MSHFKDLMTGMAVVIDDALDPTARGRRDGRDDLIVKIVEGLEGQWKLPLYKATTMPLEEVWPHLLQSACFVLLDWKLWPPGASELEEEGIKLNVRFLQEARDYSVPVFIFTNENTADVADALPEDIYQSDSPGSSFVFIQRKNQLFSGDQLVFDAIDKWVATNASVYVLKTWDKILRDARKDLFNAMYDKNRAWPRVFWRAYRDDGVDPSVSLTHLINDGLRGRMRTGAFKTEMLAGPGTQNSLVPDEDLRALISETTLQRLGLDGEIRCGDLFRERRQKFLLNIRPDCDCVPRSNGPNAIDLYCIEGVKIGPSELHRNYRNGHFTERSDEAIVFAALEGKSIRFKFKKLSIRKFGDLGSQRIGRLLPPYLTRIQQRYALFLQRQGLPRIPRAAIPPKAASD